MAEAEGSDGRLGDGDPGLRMYSSLGGPACGGIE